MHTLHLKKPLAFFDLETTGVNIVRDRIVEISVVKALVNGETEIRTRRINPEMPIPLESSLIHGIYDEDVKDAPTFKSIAKNLSSFLEGCDLAGFNSNRFDIPMLVEEFLRVGVDFDIKNRRMVDVQRIYHMMEPRNLGAAYKYYCGKTLNNAHSAEADTIATFEVLQGQIEKYQGVTITDSHGKVTEPVKNDVAALHELTASKIVDFGRPDGVQRQRRGGFQLWQTQWQASDRHPEKRAVVFRLDDERRVSARHQTQIDGD